VLAGVVLVALGGAEEPAAGGDAGRNLGKTVGFCVLVFIAGNLLPPQGVVNHAGAKMWDYPLQGTFVSFVGGMLALGIMFAVLTFGFEGRVFPKFAFKPEVPAAYYCSGFIGAYQVFNAMFVGPKITMSMCFMLVLLGQMCGSMPLDHFGFLNIPRRDVTPLRICGGLVAFCGVLGNGWVNYQAGRGKGKEGGEGSAFRDAREIASKQVTVLDEPQRNEQIRRMEEGEQLPEKA
jgi:transporter family-2 protein